MRRLSLVYLPALFAMLLASFVGCSGGSPSPPAAIPDRQDREVKLVQKNVKLPEGSKNVTFEPASPNQSGTVLITVSVYDKTDDVWWKEQAAASVTWNGGTPIVSQMSDFNLLPDQADKKQQLDTLLGVLDAFDGVTLVSVTSGEDSLIADVRNQTAAHHLVSITAKSHELWVFDESISGACKPDSSLASWSLDQTLSWDVNVSASKEEQGGTLDNHALPDACLRLDSKTVEEASITAIDHYTNKEQVQQEIEGIRASLE